MGSNYLEENVIEKVHSLLDDITFPSFESISTNRKNTSYNFQEFLDRASTFKALYWGTHPEIIILLARYGWIYEEERRVQCTQCISTLDFTHVLEQETSILGTKKVDALELAKEGHTNYCRWKGVPLPESSITLPSEPWVAYKHFCTRAKLLLPLGIKLPKFQEEILASIGIDETTLKFLTDLIEVPMTEETTAAVLLALFGWTKPPTEDALTCSFCRGYAEVVSYFGIGDNVPCPDEVGMSDVDQPIESLIQDAIQVPDSTSEIHSDERIAGEMMDFEESVTNNSVILENTTDNDNLREDTRLTLELLISSICESDESHSENASKCSRPKQTIGIVAPDSIPEICNDNSLHQEIINAGESECASSFQDDKVEDRDDVMEISKQRILAEEGGEYDEEQDSECTDQDNEVKCSTEDVTDVSEPNIAQENSDSKCIVQEHEMKCSTEDAMELSEQNCAEEEDSKRNVEDNEVKCCMEDKTDVSEPNIAQEQSDSEHIVQEHAMELSEQSHVDEDNSECNVQDNEVKCCMEDKTDVSEPNIAQEQSDSEHIVQEHEINCSTEHAVELVEQTMNIDQPHSKHIVQDDKLKCAETPVELSKHHINTEKLNSEHVQNNELEGCVEVAMDLTDQNFDSDKTGAEDAENNEAKCCTEGSMDFFYQSTSVEKRESEDIECKGEKAQEELLQAEELRKNEADLSHGDDTFEAVDGAQGTDDNCNSMDVNKCHSSDCDAELEGSEKMNSSSCSSRPLYEKCFFNPSKRHIYWCIWAKGTGSHGTMGWKRTLELLQGLDLNINMDFSKMSNLIYRLRESTKMLSPAPDIAAINKRFNNLPTSEQVLQELRKPPKLTETQMADESTKVLMLERFKELRKTIASLDSSVAGE